MKTSLEIFLFLAFVLNAFSCSKKDEVGASSSTTSSTSSTSTAYVKIPDANFEQALIDLKIDTDATLNGQISTSDAQKATSFNVSFKKIKDLTGIEGFTNLKELRIGYNSLTTVDLNNNVNLTVLVCHYNSLSGKLDLKKLTNLTSLDAIGNANLTTICVVDASKATANANFQKDATANYAVCN